MRTKRLKGRDRHQTSLPNLLESLRIFLTICVRCGGREASQNLSYQNVPSFNHGTGAVV